MCLIQCDEKNRRCREQWRGNVKIFIATFSQERRSKAASINPRENAARFIIYIHRTSLRGLAYTVRAVARHLNCRRVQRGD